MFHSSKLIYWQVIKMAILKWNFVLALLLTVLQLLTCGQPDGPDVDAHNLSHFADHPCSSELPVHFSQRAIIEWLSNLCPPLSRGRSAWGNLKSMSTLLFPVTQHIHKLSAEWLGHMSQLVSAQQGLRVQMLHLPFEVDVEEMLSRQVKTVCYCVHGSTVPDKNGWRSRWGLIALFTVVIIEFFIK